MRTASLVIAGLVWAVTPATTLAQDNQWKWTSSPEQSSNGGHCWMGIGHSGRKFSVHATSARGNFLGLDSPALGGLAAQESGSVTFAGGTPQFKHYKLAWRKADSEPTTYIASGIDNDGVIAVLKGMILAEGFDDGMSVAVGSSGDMRFPVAGSTKAAEGFAGCMDQF